MPLAFRVLAIVLVFVMSGAPTWLATLLEDDRTERCANEPHDACSDEDCPDCSVVCSSCLRHHIVLPSASLRPAIARHTTDDPSVETGDRMPASPPPAGVFHPPRRTA